MSRRTGQNGNVYLATHCKQGRCEHKKGLCPKYGRYWLDVQEQYERKQVTVSLGKVTQSVAERRLRQHIISTGVDSVEIFLQATTTQVTFKQQAEWWIEGIKAGRILRKKKRTPMKPATILSYESAAGWLSHISGGGLGPLPLAEIRNEAAKTLVAKMRNAKFSDKTMVNYFQIVQSVVASAVNEEGEQIYPRKWNLQFIGLPVVDSRKQNKPTSTAPEIESIIGTAKGRYRVLFALLAGTGLRVGEALGLKIEHLSPDCNVIYVRQSLWRKNTQIPKTENSVRDVDVPKDLAEALRQFIGDRRSGFLFQTASGKPMSQRNALRDGLNSVLTKLNIKQDGKGFHTFRRFRVAHIRKNGVPWDLEKFWIGHADKDTTDKYAEQLKEDLKFRQEWVERIGLGFTISPPHRIKNFYARLRLAAFAPIRLERIRQCSMN